MEGPQMQQGHDFLRAPPAPPATTVPAAAPAEFGRPNVIFDGTPWNRAFLFKSINKFLNRIVETVVRVRVFFEFSLLVMYCCCEWMFRFTL